MFQTVKPEEIFDRAYWHVSEQHPAYWLAQLRKKEWIRLLFLLSMKPASRATKPVLAGLALEKLEFQVCDDRLEAYRAWQQNPGSFVIQYRHSDTDWSRGIPEILPPEMGDHLGFVHIAGRLVCRQKAGLDG
jgi:hypothetical protein